MFIDTIKVEFNTSWHPVNFQPVREKNVLKCSAFEPIGVNLMSEEWINKLSLF